MIKFNLFSVTNGAHKVKIWYSLDNHVDGKKCVAIYAIDYGSQLRGMFPVETENHTDITIDYFERDKVRFLEDHPLYLAARTTADKLETKRKKQE